MSNDVERTRRYLSSDQVLEVLQEIEDMMENENAKYVTIEVFTDGSGAVGPAYSEERKEYFSFGDLDEFLVEADKLIRSKRNVIEVHPDNIVFENDEIMVVRKEAE